MTNPQKSPQVLLSCSKSNLKIIPESVGKKIKQVLNAKKIDLVYNPNLKNFSKEKNEFATFPQLKLLLQDLYSALS